MSDRVVAVVPIRSWQNGKTRLAPILSPGAREALLRSAAKGVVDAAVASGVLEAVVVVSPDPAVLAWASGYGAAVVPLRQTDALPGLNGAIEAGRSWAVARGADRILSIFADLPLLAAEDVRDMVVRQDEIVLGPDRNGEGTNALLLRLDGQGQDFRFAFGVGSLARHAAEAERLGLGLARHESLGIGFDLDTPRDWIDLLEAMANDDGERTARETFDGICAG